MPDPVPLRPSPPAEKQAVAISAQPAAAAGFHEVVRHSAVGITLVDAAGRIAAANPAFGQMLGSPPEPLVGWLFADLVHPEDRARLAEATSRVLGGAVPAARLVLRELATDGREICIDLTLTAVATGGGVGQWFGQSIDITAPIQAEATARGLAARCEALQPISAEGQALAQVQAAGELLHKLAAQVPGVLWVLRRSPEGRYTLPFASTALGELFGIEPAPLALDAGPLFALIHPDDRPGLLAALEESARLLTRMETVYRLTNPGRPERWHLTAAQPERLPDGTVLAHGFTTDITNQRRIEQLRLAEALRYRTLLATATDGIHLLDADGRLVEANEAFRRQLGYTAEEAAGLSLADWRRDWPRAEVGARLAAYRERSGVGETQHWPKDGSCCEVEVSITGLDLGGRWQYFCAARDLTDRRRVERERRLFEEQMQQVQRLESLGVLAGGIAHDFNNLLTAILGNADLAAFDLTAGSPAQEPLQEIVRASRRAAELCRQMLAYAGREKIVVTPLALPGLIEEMLQMLRASVPKKIALRHQFASPLPLVEGDASQLRQVVMNLVLNAAEAIGDSEGAIAVRLGLETVAPTGRERDWLGAPLAPEPHVCIEVVDTGCGMTPETQARIFEPFFTTKFTGRGLGLSAVLGIVRSHRGALRVDSAPGRGTTFRVLLPARPEGEVLPVAQPRPTAGWRGRGCVLLVDDEESVRRLGRRMLERLGFAVVVAEGGREALRRIDEPGAAFVCIVLDYAMPDLDGSEVLEELVRRKCPVPVLLSSGFGASEVAKRFAGRGLAGVLTKPYELAAMAECLRAIGTAG